MNMIRTVSFFLCALNHIVKVQDRGLVYSPMLIPRQFRFSLNSEAVITEGLMW